MGPGSLATFPASEPVWAAPCSGAPTAGPCTPPHSCRGAIRVDLYDIETGSRREWKQIPVDEDLTRRFVRVTPDGRGYVYSGVTVSSELYLVEGLR